MRDIPAWAADYVGIPWRVHGRDRAGCDCWGLVRLVLSERFGIEVPAYNSGYQGASRADIDDIAQLIADRPPQWAEVERGQERPGDVVLLRLWGRPCHVGIVVGGGRMLHIEEGVDSVCEPYDGPAWRKKVAGIYRWRGYRLEYLVRQPW